MYAPSPAICMQTPQREFAGAKLQKNIDVGKFWGEKVRRKWILQEKYEKTRSWRLRVFNLLGMYSFIKIINIAIN